MTEQSQGALVIALAAALLALSGCTNALSVAPPERASASASASASSQGGSQIADLVLETSAVQAHTAELSRAEDAAIKKCMTQRHHTFAIPAQTIQPAAFTTHGIFSGALPPTADTTLPPSVASAYKGGTTVSITTANGAVVELATGGCLGDARTSVYGSLENYANATLANLYTFSLADKVYQSPAIAAKVESTLSCAQQQQGHVAVNAELLRCAAANRLDDTLSSQARTILQLSASDAAALSTSVQLRKQALARIR